MAMLFGSKYKIKPLEKAPAAADITAPDHFIQNLVHLINDETIQPVPVAGTVSQLEAITFTLEALAKQNLILDLSNQKISLEGVEKLAAALSEKNYGFTQIIIGNYDFDDLKLNAFAPFLKKCQSPVAITLLSNHRLTSKTAKLTTEICLNNPNIEKITSVVYLDENTKTFAVESDLICSAFFTKLNDELSCEDESSSNKASDFLEILNAFRYLINNSSNIDLNYIHISKLGMQKLGYALLYLFKDLSKLKNIPASINLENCNIDDDKFKLLAHFLQFLAIDNGTKITLNLTQNPLTTENSAKLIDELRKNQSIAAIQTDLDKASTTVMSKSLFFENHLYKEPLETLDLHEFTFSFTGFQKLMQDIIYGQKNYKLINLRNCKLDDNTAISIADMLQNNRNNIQTLDLSNNNLSIAGIEIIKLAYEKSKLTTNIILNNMPLLPEKKLDTFKAEFAAMHYNHLQERTVAL